MKIALIIREWRGNMAGIFISQMDYLIFFHGLVSILLAVMVFPLSRRSVPTIPWRWLGLFGLINGINEWLSMLTLSLGDVLFFAVTRHILMAGSFLCLLEFGRASTSATGGKAPGQWIFLPLLALAASGIMAGLTGADASIHYALGLIGGLWAAWALYRHHRWEYPGSGWIMAAALAMALYALTTGIDVPEVAFFPASVINHESFLAATGFPVKFLLGLLMAVMAFAFWQNTEKARRVPSASLMSRITIESFFLLLLCVVLIAGWMVTGWVGRFIDHEERNHLLERAKACAAVINENHVAWLAGTKADLLSPYYNGLKDQLSRERQAVSDTRFYYLLSKKGEQVIFLVDSEPEDSKDYSPPGQVFEEASPELRKMYNTGTPFTEGPVPDRWGTWISGFVPITTGDGRVIAMLGVDIDASHWDAKINQHRLAPILVTMLLSILIMLSYVALWMSREAGETIARYADEQSLLLDSIETQVWYLKNAETYGAVNDAHAAFLGLPKGMLEHKTLWKVFPEAKARMIIEGNQAVFDAKQPTHTEEWMSDASGQDRFLAIVKTPKIDSAGDVEYVVCSAEDITERKLAAEERTRREKFQGVLEIAGTVCHEMNQPLQVISGYIDLLLMSATEGNQSYLKLSMIKEQIQRINIISSKLMMISEDYYETIDYIGMSRIIDISKIPDAGKK
jgi:PAS domain S-box-containing protein